jgi:hypothetical protein
MTTIPIVANGSPEPLAVVEKSDDKAVETTRRGNTSQGGWIVQKFGGTSVGKFAVNIAEDIVR